MALYKRISVYCITAPGKIGVGVPIYKRTLIFKNINCYLFYFYYQWNNPSVYPKKYSTFVSQNKIFVWATLWKCMSVDNEAMNTLRESRGICVQHLESIGSVVSKSQETT